MAESTASVESVPAELTASGSVEEDLILEDDLLVEDVSIDGMCGVY
jgi:mycofactocin precursor